VQSATEYWKGVEDVDVISLPEGEAEAGQARERLTADRLDRLAVFFAAPDHIRSQWSGPKEVKELALSIGCRVGSVEKWKRHPFMVKRTAELLYAAAVYAMPNILFAQMELATNEADTKAANFVATVGKFIRSQGTTINNTQVSPMAEVHAPPDAEQVRTAIKEIMEEDDVA